MLSFCHMMPHSLETFESIGISGEKTFQYTLLGYLCVFFIEKIVFNSHSVLHSMTGGDGGPHHHHHHTQHHDVVKPSGSKSAHSDHDHNHVHDSNCNATCELGGSQKHVAPANKDSVGRLSPQSAIMLLVAMCMHR